MGDAENEIERMYIKNKLWKANILRTGHHCSDTSSSESFIKYVNPDVAICSVGSENKYGHPSKYVLDRFRKWRVDVLRTDTDGDIVVKW
jgi:competence protein ComEC